MVAKGLRLALYAGLVAAILVVVASALGSGGTVDRTHRESHVHARAAATRRHLDSAYGRLPLSFEQNRGQADRRVRFLAHGGDFTLGLTKTGPLLALYRRSRLVRAAAVGSHARADGARVSVRALSVVFAGASGRVRLVGTAPLAGRVNYLIGKNRSRWHTDIPTFAGATYRGVWRGIDATFSGSHDSLEYVFTVAPGGDPGRIALVYHGQSGLRLDRKGDLLLAAGPGRTVRQLAPHAYQVIRGRRRGVASRYALTGGRVTISVGAYDRSRALVIDPTLDYSTYLGGANNDYGTAIAVDGSGSAYVTGYTSSTDFPTFPRPGAYQPANGGPGAYDAFVSKLTPNGDALVYSTYLGGANWDQGQGIAVDAAGSAYITGWASSSDFPTTAGAYQTANRKTPSGGSAAFVTKLQPNGGALAYSTYLGGSGFQDIGYGIAVDGSGSAYITGDTDSIDFPTTPGAYQPANAGGRDAFLSKLSANGSALVYSTYLGGANTDYGTGVAVDGSHHAYVTGYALSADFPTTAGAYQSAHAGDVDVFVSKVDPAGAGNSDLVYSTYLGGTARDAGAAIAVDGSGSAYVTGSTASADFPTTSGAYRTTYAGTGSNAFVSKLAADGRSLAYSTYLGGNQFDWGNAIAVDGSGRAYLTGHTSSNDFPTTPGAFQTTNPGTEAFVSSLSASGSTLTYSTYLGAGGDEGSGIALDAAGSAYVTGYTFASTFPTTTGAYQTTFGGAYDAFVTKITPPKRPTATSLSCSPASVTVGSTSTCTATVSDTGSGTKITPTGTVSVVSDSAGAFSSPGASCTLAATATIGTASCTVHYTPSARGSGTHQITGSYGGDSTHATSSGSTNLTVTAAPGPPSATVTTPADGASYAFGSVVNANYSCSPGANGGVLKAGTAGCSGPVANGSPIDTSTAGAHSFTVTATDTDGQTATTTSNYTVTAAPAPPGPPSAAITTPADGASYALGSVVNANYSCSAGANGGVLRPGTAGCSGPVANGSPIDTSTAGAHSFAVTATDTDGQTATTTTNYSVTAAPAPPGPPAPPMAPPGPPTVKLITPFDGASYTFGSVVAANYVCSPGANGGVLKPGTAGCSAPVASGSPIDTTTFGTRTFTVTATDTDGQTATISIHYTLDYVDRQPTPVRPKHPVILVSPVVDIRVTGIEVNQSIQAINCNCFGTLPSRSDLLGKTPGQATYEGVTMAAGKYTIVRVFAHATNLTNPAATSLRGATATLRIFDSSEREISAPLQPDISPSALTPPDCFACVTEAERSKSTAAFLFVVPWDSTYHRSLTFRATVSTPVGLSAPVQCGGCNANVFTLRGVPFASTADVELYPIPLTLGGVQTTQTVDQVFDSAQTVLPVNVNIHPYETPLPIDSLNTTQAAAAVAKRASDEKRNSSQYAIGVFTAGSLSGSGGLTTGGPLFSASAPISIVSDSRPLTSTMHEIGHGLGLVHADTGSPPNATGPHPDGTADCGGNSNKQVGENWPPDNEGRIQGVGFDLRNWTARILDTGQPTSASTYYDFMSYCPGVSGTQVGTVAQNEANHWISVVNWNRLIAFHPPAQSLPLFGRGATRIQAAGESGLRVIATVDPAGKASIFDVAPVDQAGTDSTAGSTYRIELRDAFGGTLASVVPTSSSVHSDGQSPGVLLEATLPFAPSAASVVFSSGGVELAQRTRSAHAPTVTIVSPDSGTPIGLTSNTLVRWTANDADADPLTSSVDYSDDGGNQWKVVASGVSGDSVNVPSRLLSASDNARFRIRVSDGFDVATAISGVLRAAGAPPSVHITGGTRGGGRMRADTMLLLRGTAYDDAGTRLTGRSLRWYAGGHLLGRGELLTVHGLPAGTTAVRLVAIDRHGRSARTSLPLKVLAVRPTFLVARAPKRVAPSARRVRIVIASNVPAVLTIARGRFAVGRTPRALTIAIRPGRAALRLVYSLRSPGGATRGTYIARR